MKMRDEIDHIMEVMGEAFDPAYGEAWTRRQVSDALILGNCRSLLMDETLQPPNGEADAAGFVLSRARCCIASLASNRSAGERTIIIGEPFRGSMLSASHLNSKIPIGIFFRRESLS
jgi:hypothetical protein